MNRVITTTVRFSYEMILTFYWRHDCVDDGVVNSWKDIRGCLQDYYYHLHIPFPPILLGTVAYNNTYLLDTALQKVAEI